MNIYAFPSKFEAEGLLDVLKNRKALNLPGIQAWKGMLVDNLVIIAVIGIGPKAAAQLTQKLIELTLPRTIILAGFAGALCPQLTRGQIIVVRNYSTETLVNYIRLIPGFDLADTFTAESLAATVEQKHILERETQCQIIDMETSVVAEVAAQNGLEFMAVRVVSDLADEEIPGDVLNKGFNVQTGMPDPKSIALYLLTHPHRIGPFRRFLKSLPPVRKRLTAFLQALGKDLD